MYKTWGPSLLRKFDVLLQGYEYCLDSDNPNMQNHKIIFFKKQAALLWSLLESMDRFAPNGVVRRRVRKMDEKYRKLIGEPTAVQEALSNKIDSLAKDFYIKNTLDPFNRYPKEEPTQKYLYLKTDKLEASDKPYITKLISKVPFELRWTNFIFFTRANLLKIIRKLKFRNGDRLIDDFIINCVRTQNFGCGF